MKADKKLKGYQRRFKKFGRDPRALQWRNKQAAEKRYREVVAEIDFEGKTVLDVGCGFGDIIPHIESKAKNFEYTGVDLVPEFVEEARKLHPRQNFQVRDYFNDPMEQRFDVILSVGTLNGNVKDNMGYRKESIKTMFERAGEVLAFDMEGAHPQPKTSEKSNVWYADPLEIRDYCLTLTPKVILSDKYHRRNFVVVMFK